MTFSNHWNTAPIRRLDRSKQGTVEKLPCKIQMKLKMFPNTWEETARRTARRLLSVIPKAVAGNDPLIARACNSP